MKKEGILSKFFLSVKIFEIGNLYLSKKLWTFLILTWKIDNSKFGLSINMICGFVQQKQGIKLSECHLSHVKTEKRLFLRFC